VRLRKRLAAAGAVAAAIPLPLAFAGDPEQRTTVSPTLRPPLAGQDSAAEAMRGSLRDRLAREHVRLARRYDQLTGRRTAAAAAARATALPPVRLRAANHELRGEVSELDIPVPPVLRRVAQCESHGNPRAIGGGGSFRGAFQFMASTWQAVGGEGDPADAPLEEQYRRAAILMARSGSSPWPACGA
jgi:hypothetical protein